MTPLERAEAEQAYLAGDWLADLDDARRALALVVRELVADDAARDALRRAAPHRLAEVELRLGELHTLTFGRGPD